MFGPSVHEKVVCVPIIQKGDYQEKTHPKLFREMVKKKHVLSFSMVSEW